MEILQIYAHDYAEKVSRLQSSVNMLLPGKDFWDDPMFCAALESEMEDLQQICEKGELAVTNVLVSHLVKVFHAVSEKSAPTAQLLAHTLTTQLLAEYLERIRLTFIDELSTKVFFQLSNQKKKWFESPAKGWEPTIERFPETVRDVEEMSKCFALSRYAASVFHSLLVVERGLIELGHVIGVSDPKPGWDATCSRMKTLLDGGHKNYPASLGIGFSALEQINQGAQSMKLAWRNKVNHSAGQLTVIQADFVPDVAEEIIVATRAFMRRLATDLP